MADLEAQFKGSLVDVILGVLSVGGWYVCSGDGRGVGTLEGRH